MPADGSPIVEIFSGPYCTHCESARSLLNDTGVPFVERRVDDPDELFELRRRAPRAMALPQIFVAGEHIGNDDDLRLRHDHGRSPFDSAAD